METSALKEGLEAEGSSLKNLRKVGLFSWFLYVYSPRLCWS